MKHNGQAPQAREREELERQVEILRREVRQLRLQQDLLNKANELLTNGIDVDLQLLSNREKTLLIDALNENYDLQELLAQLGLARISYFYYRAGAAMGDKYLEVPQSLTEIFETNHRCYGYRRLQASLAREQGQISEMVVLRQMRQESLVVAKPKRRRYASYLGAISPAPENIINREFHAAAPNEKWLTDITEFQILAGKVYLSPIIDSFDGMVVSWTIDTSPDAELDAAIETVTVTVTATATATATSDRPEVHSDRRGRYRWPGWLSRMSKANLTRSMSRKACSPDNAACEGFLAGC